MNVVLENECIEESDNHNLCADLSDTATGSLYLASPSLFIARGLSARTKCRCEVHAESSLQMEILFADVSVSRFTATCGQWTISEDSFSTNVTNEVLPVPQNISDCVIEVDERSNGKNSYPVHKVWTKITGSSLTFRCNNNTSSSTPAPPSAETSETDDKQLSLASSSSSSSQTTATTTFVRNTQSSQTSILETRQDALTTSSVTRFQTHNNTGDQTNNAGDKDSTTTYVIIGVVIGGVVLIGAVVFVVIIIRKSDTIYDSLRHPNARRASGAGYTEDNEHTYCVIRPAQRPEVQLAAATATTDGQRMQADELTIQTQGYENVGMTYVTEAATGNCPVCPNYINVSQQ